MAKTSGRAAGAAALRPGAGGVVLPADDSEGIPV